MKVCAIVRRSLQFCQPSPAIEYFAPKNKSTMKSPCISLSHAHPLFSFRWKAGKYTATCQEKQCRNFYCKQLGKISLLRHISNFVKILFTRVEEKNSFRIARNQRTFLCDVGTDFFTLQCQ